MVPLLGLTRYTGPAQQALVLAEQQALADGAPAISTGDMLLGLLRADQAVAAAALESLGITAEAVRRQLQDMTRPEEDGASSYGISRRITSAPPLHPAARPPGAEPVARESRRTGPAEPIHSHRTPNRVSSSA